MTETCFTIVYTALWIGFSVCCLGIVLSAYSVYHTKQRLKVLQEEEARCNRRWLNDLWRTVGSEVAVPFDSFVWSRPPLSPVAEKQYIDIVLTIVRDKREIIVLKNNCNHKMMLGKWGEYNSLVIDVDVYKEPNFVMIKEFNKIRYCLDLPLNYTGPVRISDDFSMNHVISSVKNCYSCFVTYINDCGRIELNV